MSWRFFREMVMKEKSIFIGGLIAFVFILAGIIYLGLQSFLLKQSIAQTLDIQIVSLRERFDRQIEVVNKQQARLNELESRTINLQKDLEQIRLTVESSISKINQLQNDSRALSDKLSSHEKWSVEKLTKLSNQVKVSEPHLNELPHSELEKISFKVKGVEGKSSNDSKKYLTEINLTNDSSWFVQSIIVEKTVPGMAGNNRLRFEFNNLVAPTRKAIALTNSSCHVLDIDPTKWTVVERTNWRIVSAMGYESYTLVIDNTLTTSVGLATK